MNICSRGHEEVCYESLHCPTCEVLVEKSWVEEEVEDLESQVKELESKVEKLEDDRCTSLINHVGNPCTFCGKSCEDYPDAEHL